MSCLSVQLGHLLAPLLQLGAHPVLHHAAQVEVGREAVALERHVRHRVHAVQLQPLEDGVPLVRDAGRGAGGLPHDGEGDGAAERVRHVALLLQPGRHVQRRRPVDGDQRAAAAASSGAAVVAAS
eukprot:CAMPEP_0202905978 /NCGR_PEP_ID=MMETSP1392-20130828/36882_1 /ASSEMBLY_ACC=CAM_ASM_000868 /TAXON_ID=225041 /ORGANISM="Chlamydomonas chlamydogama, Strain SAG 11-48b" /LENGTH=124 /DNA_ID=CAMNT_0049594305 /DNA_START=1076 /DNA_END=1447 /DNA_ORIENTATION=-